MITREIRKTEYEELRSVWCEVFGDDPDFVDELYYNMKATGYTVEDEGRLHSFLTLFEAGELNGKKVMVSYGICTRPDSRGKGYAGELVKFVRDKVISDGAVSLICPAEPSLVDFYTDLGYGPAFFAKNLEAAASDEEEIIDIPDSVEIRSLNDDIDSDCQFDSSESEVRIKILTPKDYNKYREAFLADIPHVSFNDSFMKFVKNDSVNAQGMLLINGGDAICTISYGSDKEMGISELIVDPKLESFSSEISEELAAGLARLFEVETAYYRKPTFIVYTDEGGDHYSRGSYVQAMTARFNFDDNQSFDELDTWNTSPYLPYYGFPVD